MTVVKTLAVTGFFLCLAVVPAAAADLAFARIVEAAKASSVIPGHTIETARSACGTALCFAQALAVKLPDHVRLEPVTHPNTDSIRRATTPPSVTAGDTGDTLQLKLTHFGRKALPELRAALASARGQTAVELDLRGNPGGDFERMLQIAGLLLGSRRDVVEIDYGDRVERRSLQGPRTGRLGVESVEIDEKTASAALLLARLLAAYAGAEVAGHFLDEKPVFLKRRITIDHDWRLILPVAEVRVAAL